YDALTYKLPATTGAAARSRALELFSVDQNVERFRALYLEIVSHYPVRRPHTDEEGTPMPFAHPAETRDFPARNRSAPCRRSPSTTPRRSTTPSTGRVSPWRCTRRWS
ncbi:hypothetical protein ACFWE4_40140, partial [Streptomyces sp. NPDC060187]